MFMRKFEFFALGSDCALQLFAEEEGQAQEAATASIREIAQIETRYSRYLNTVNYPASMPLRNLEELSKLTRKLAG